MYKAGHAFTYLLLKESVASDVINVSLFAYPVHVVCGRPLLSAHSMDPVVRNRFRKSSTPCLLYFLFGNPLIDNFTPDFFDSQTFLLVVFFC